MEQRHNIVLVGKQNVGKSSLFNKIAPKAKAMVKDYAGITRDAIMDTIQWRECTFTLIDTGGINENSSDTITKLVKKTTEAIIKNAALLVVVVDGSVDLSLQDERIISFVQKTKIPFLVILNKSDKRERGNASWWTESRNIPTISISAEQGRGIDTFLEYIESFIKKNPLPSSATLEEPDCHFVLLGKPNVGKSSIMNALLSMPRTIVSEIPGTTREPITEIIGDITITDTAGVRRKSSIENESLESTMVHSTMQAIKRSTIIGMVFDLNENALSDQDIKLAMYAFHELYKYVFIIWNKKDLITEEDCRTRIGTLTKEYRYFFDLLYQLPVSSKTGENIKKIEETITTIKKTFSKKFSSEEIQGIIKKALLDPAMKKNNQSLYIFETVVVKNTPPTIIITVHNRALFDKAILSFLTKKLRAHFSLVSTPIQWVVKQKKK